MPKFPSDRVQKALDAQLGADVSLDSDRIRTGLMQIMTERLDTGSLGRCTTIPAQKYAARDGKLPPTQVVRASTAAPTYFEPERVQQIVQKRDRGRRRLRRWWRQPVQRPAFRLLMLWLRCRATASDGNGPDKLLLASLSALALTSLMCSAEKLFKMVAAEQGDAFAAIVDGRLRSGQPGLTQWLTRRQTP